MTTVIGGAITAIHGGGGNDAITAFDHSGPLVIYGDTSASGERYSAGAGSLSDNAYRFGPDGDDVIDGFGGRDHIYGDSRFEVDLLTRETQTDVSQGAGSDDISGGEGDDIILGDNGMVIFNAGVVVTVRSTVSNIGAADLIRSGAGNDMVLGGSGRLISPTAFCASQALSLRGLAAGMTASTAAQAMTWSSAAMAAIPSPRTPVPTSCLAIWARSHGTQRAHAQF
ncbi:MAG: hypothetical protein RQ750_10575 [Roseovarius sp.]|nr:hypothetical protein [Roseovarius sp.]